MRLCFGYGSEKCDKPGTMPDYETPAIFVDPQNPDGPTVRPVHCAQHHARMTQVRDDNEASYQRIFRR
jgi:hypothetical protein